MIMILKRLLSTMNSHRVQGSTIISIPLHLANAISQQLQHFLPSKYCCTSSPRFPFFFFSLISLSFSPLLCNVFCCIFLFSVDTILLCVYMYIAGFGIGAAVLKTKWKIKTSQNLQ